MQLQINYDFFEELYNAREPFSALKIVRNKRKILAIDSVLFFTVNYLISENVGIALSVDAIQVAVFTAIEYLTGKYSKTDPYYISSALELKLLVNRLRSIGIDTNYDKILKAELYDKNFRIDSSKGKLPSIIEEKYFFLPTLADEPISMVQKHEIGSKEYILSRGKPTKQTNHVLATSH